MIRSIITILCILNCFFCFQCSAGPESFNALSKGLPDGAYLIERVNYKPFPLFSSQSEAEVWHKKYKKDPSILKPEHEFFQLYLLGSDYILHQLVQGKSGEYKPNSPLKNGGFSDI
jgi:hypothetical protein